MASVALACTSCGEEPQPEEQETGVRASDLSFTLWAQDFESLAAGTALTTLFDSVTGTTSVSNATSPSAPPQGTRAGLLQRSTTGSVEVQKRNINTVGLTNVRLTFQRRLEGTESSDTFEVRYSSNSGTSWTVLESVLGNATGVTSWSLRTGLAALPATSNLWISFRATGGSLLDGSTDKFFVDDIKLTADGECLSAADCSDNRQCTTDTCSASHVCSHANATSGTACTELTGGLTGACDGAGTCVECVADTQCAAKTNKACDTAAHVCVQCTTNTHCTTLDGNLFCNGAETCNTTTHLCLPGTPPVIDDAIACTADACNETTDQVTHSPNNAACDDAKPCTTDTCSTTAGCQHTAATNQACPGGFCKDANTCVQCTLDSHCSGSTAHCSATNTCVQCTLNSHCASNQQCVSGTCQCVPLTCAQVGGGTACGLFADGCGGTVDCTNRCSAGQHCDTSAGTTGVCVPHCSDFVKDDDELGRDCGGSCSKPCTESACSDGADADADGYTDCADIDCVEGGQCDRCSERLLSRVDWPQTSQPVPSKPTTLAFTLSAAGCSGLQLGPSSFALGTPGSTQLAATAANVAPLLACLRSQWLAADARSSVQPTFTITVAMSGQSYARDLPLSQLFAFDLNSAQITELRLVVSHSSYDTGRLATRLDYRWEVLGYPDTASDCVACPAYDPSHPNADFCSERCPCDAGEGGCRTDQDCRRNMVCEPRGARFGVQLPDFGVCVPSYCADGVLDGDEAGAADCGGPRCGSCPASCADEPTCSPSCPCPAYRGPCSADSDCTSGNACGDGNARRFGMPNVGNVCWPVACEGSACGTPQCGTCGDCQYFPVASCNSTSTTRTESVRFGSSSTRSAPGSFVNAAGAVEYVGPHVLRQKPGQSGDTLSLFEGARTNYALQSADPAQWPSTHVTFVTGAPAAPFINRTGQDVSVLSVRAQSTGAAPDQFLQQHFALASQASRPMTVSTFAQHAGAGALAGSVVLHVNGASGPTDAASSFTPTAAWQRFTNTYPLGTDGQLDAYLALDPWGAATSASSGYTLDLAMPQVEDGAFPSSWIRTFGTPVTRDLDRVALDTRTLPAWFFSGQWTVAVEPVFGSADVTGSAQRFVLFDFGAPDQWLGFESDGRGNLALVAVHGAQRTALTLPMFVRGAAFTITVNAQAGELRSSLTSAFGSSQSWHWPIGPVSVGARSEGSNPEPAFAWIGRPTASLPPASSCTTQSYADGTPCGKGASSCYKGMCLVSSACGDGVLDQDGVLVPFEACDDGNRAAGDGCSPECATEALAVGNDAALLPPGVSGHALGVDGEGRLLFVWEATKGDTAQLLARRATANGELVDTELVPIVLANDFAPAWPAEPAVAGLPNGGWVVAWTDPDQDAEASRAVFRLVGRDGSVGPLRKVSADSAAAQHESSVQVAGTRDGFVVLWVDQRNVFSSAPVSTVLARRFDPLGVALGDTLAVSPAAQTSDVDPALAALGSQWAAVWTRGNADRALYVRRFDGDTPLDDATLVTSHAASPALAPLLPSHGDYALAWVDSNDQRVRSLELLAHYAPEIGNAQVLADPSERRPAVAPSVAALGENAFAVGFGYGDGYRDGDLMVVARAGELHTARPDETALRALLRGPSNQRDVQLVGAENGVWFSWQDDGVARGSSTTQLPNGVRSYLLGCEDCGLAWSPGCYAQSTKLAPTDMISQPSQFETGATLGASVAAAGTFAVFGAPLDATRGAQTGSAYVYRYEGGAWIKDSKLTASDAAAETTTSPSLGVSFGPRFGGRVATDGRSIIVGAAFKDDTSARIDAGGVYVYDRSTGSTWIETKLMPPTTATDRNFGGGVAISGDWAFASELTSATIGSTQDVYRRTDQGWAYSSSIAAPFSNVTRLFNSLSVDGDDMLIMCLATLSGSSKTSACVFHWDGSGWRYVTALAPTASTSSAAISHGTIIIGSQSYAGASVAEGAAFVYRQVEGTWALVQTLRPSDLAAGTEFGQSVAMRGDVAVIGADFQAIDVTTQVTPALNKPGKGYVYVRNTQSNDWVLERSISAFDATVADQLGGAFAIMGANILAGAPRATVSGYTNRPGAVYAFACSPTDSCGDGWLVAGEDCDDGNRVTESCPTSTSCEVCDASCHLAYPRCGDGVVQGGENCDDGNAVTEYCTSGSACKAQNPLPVCESDCTRGPGLYCGDGIVTAGREQCDDGNTVDNDACKNNCTLGCVASASTDTSCDAQDQDCDGVKDDDYVATSTTCGHGVCSRSGTVTCVSGILTSACTPGPTTGTDNNCNGVNEDCDLVTDESYPITPTSCGVGVCARAGQRVCVNGVQTDNCVPGPTTGIDNNCNGVDENCSGANDENYAPVPVSCGQGVCRVTTNTRCTSGVVDMSCTPGAPQSSLDFNCNALDEDCDGTNDDDYVRPNVSCGVGACKATVQASCVNGSVTSSCTALSPPSATDATCNGIDDNCNGSTDEGFVGTATSCGVGGCARSGVTSCVGGVVRDSCVPGAPASDDFTCDNVDDDCDGTRDENCTCSGTAATVSAHVTAGRAYRQDVSCGTTNVTVLSDTFEGASLDPRWTKTGTINIAAIGTANPSLPLSTKVADMTRSSLLASNPKMTTTVNTTGLGSITLSYWRRAPSSGDTLTVRYSTNGGTSWTVVDNAVAGIYGWTQKTATALPAVSSLLLSFETSMSSSHHIYIDDVTITGTTPCTTPTWFAAGSNELIGTNVNATVTLFSMQSAPTVWHLGACPVCGNGTVEFGEACDDHNRVNEYCAPNTTCAQICNDHCQLASPPRCGDGQLNLPQEQCDDGNTVDTDNCKNDCTIPCSLSCGWGCQANTCLQPVQLAGASYYECAAMTDGRMACWGNGGVPTIATGFSNVVKVAAGNTHTCALLADRTVRCSGSNGQGQLGNGGGGAPGPVQVTGINDAISIGAGQGHTCVARANGQVACWGENGLGELGDGTTSNRSTPVTVPGISDAVAVGIGPWHSCALLSNRTIRCWGRNEYGQLGNGGSTTRLLPVQVAGINNAVQITVGVTFTCARLSDGTVSCWGGNGSGGLGTGTNSSTPTVIAGINDAVDVSAFAAHACILRSAGQVMCWGFNEHGQLGDGTTLTNPRPQLVPNLTARAVSVGWQHTCAVNTAGTVLCWGSNDFKELGDGTFVDTSTPKSVLNLTDATQLSSVVNHNCAKRANGSVVCWGYDGDSQLGDGTTKDASTPVTVTGLTNVAEVQPGFHYTCTRRSTGQVACWGAMVGYPSGTSSLTPVDLPAVPDATKLGRGYTESCAVRTNGHVICWGYNDGIGNHGPTEVAGVTDAVSVNGEVQAQCAVRSNGHVACFGRNDFGLLGDGTTTSRYTFGDVSNIVDAVKVSVGETHACAVRSGGGVMCWGQNGYGQLGTGTQIGSNVPVAAVGISDAIDVSVGIYFTCAVRSGGGVMCWGNQNGGGPGPTPVAVAGITDAVEVASGVHHTCVRRSGGGVYCWGNNVQGQVGVGAFPYSKVPVRVLTP